MFSVVGPVDEEETPYHMGVETPYHMGVETPYHMGVETPYHMGVETPYQRHHIIWCQCDVISYS